jgi:hypothetical protein
MKRLFFLFSFLGSAMCTQAQQTEYLASANSGIFSFGGLSAEKFSEINAYTYKPFQGYTNNPYGSNPGLVYGLSGQVQRENKNTMLSG